MRNFTNPKATVKMFDVKDVIAASSADEATETFVTKPTTISCMCDTLVENLVSIY